MLYAKAGVPEYWLVDLTRRTVELFREPNQSAGRFADHQGFKEGESFASRWNSAAPIAVVDLLPRAR